MQHPDYLFRTMAALTSGQYLPPELIRVVFEHLPRQDLTTVRFVSRDWCKLAFPYLHQDRTIEGLVKLERFTLRLNTSYQTIEYLPCIGSCLRSLTLSFVRKRSLPTDEASVLDVLRRFRSVIPKLKHLKYLKWKELFYFDTPVVIDILREFADRCPELNGLTVVCYTHRPGPHGPTTGEVYIFSHYCPVIIINGYIIYTI